MKKVLALLLITASILLASEKLYIVNGKGEIGTISKFENGQITNNIANTGKFPNQLTHHDGKLFVVNSGSNNIKIFQEANLKELPSIQLKQTESNPWKMAIANNKIYVTGLYSTGVEVWTTSGEYIKTITIPDINPKCGTGAIWADGDKVFVNRNNYTYPDYFVETIFVVDAKKDSILTNFKSAVNVASITTAGDKLHILAAGNYGNIQGYVKILNLSNYQTIDSVFIGLTPNELKPMGNEMLVATSGYAEESSFAKVVKYSLTTNKIVQDLQNPLYSSEAGIMDLCVVNNDFYISIFDKDKLGKVSGSTLSNSWDTGSGPQWLCMVGATDLEESTAKSTNLINAYPNPFNNSTRIIFNLSQAGQTEALLYNQNGQLVKSLLRGYLSNGTNSLDLHADNLNSGLYFVKVISQGRVIATQKIMLIK